MSCITIFTGYGYASMLNSRLKEFIFGTAAGSLYWQTTCSRAIRKIHRAIRVQLHALFTIHSIHFVLIPKVFRIEKTLGVRAKQHLQLILLTPTQLPCFEVLQELRLCASTVFPGNLGENASVRPQVTCDIL